MADGANASGIQSTSKDKFRIGARAIVCQEADLRGDVTVGAVCILHAHCVIHALNGPIILGEGCIVEELAVIINKLSSPMIIGSYNHFETASHVEAASIGSHNIFEPRSHTHAGIELGSYCIVGTACHLYAQPSLHEDDWAAVQPFPTTRTGTTTEHDIQSLDLQEQQGPPLPPKSSSDVNSAPLFMSKLPATPVREAIPDYTVIYGAKSMRRSWSGEGSGQQVALHHKHLAYLTETLPRYNILKLVTQ